MFISLKLVNC